MKPVVPPIPVILSVYGPGRICFEAGMQRDTENAVQSITDPLPVWYYKINNDKRPSRVRGALVLHRNPRSVRSHKVIDGIIKNTWLEDLYCWNNKRDISTYDGRITYKSLPGFKLAKATDIKFERQYRNDVVDVGKTAFNVLNNGRITYTYNMGRGFTEEFTININFIESKITSVKLPKSTFVYTGSPIEPAATVKAKVNGKIVTLKEDQDYYVTYVSNTVPGTATMTIEGLRHFKGSFTKTFKIVRAKLTSATFSDTKVTYNGYSHCPEVTVKRNDHVLRQGTDYTVKYKNNTDAGTATVTIKGIGNYTGTITKKFTITPVKILKVTLSETRLPYTGKERKPIPTVTTRVDGRLVTLEKNKDYTVKYENNIEIGTATVTITGKGNFTGTFTKTFKIIEQ